MIEEDGDEIFTPISDVLCCGYRLIEIRGFWRCQICNASYGQVFDNVAIRAEQP
jgi:hypothetical protein